jgi:hypothetical protein
MVDLPRTAISDRKCTRRWKPFSGFEKEIFRSPLVICCGSLLRALAWEI